MLTTEQIIDQYNNADRMAIADKVETYERLIDDLIRQVQVYQEATKPKWYNQYGKKVCMQFDSRVPIEQMKDVVVKAMAQDKNCYVTVRQLDGTDFPPFISIESPELAEKIDTTGNYELLMK